MAADKTSSPDLIVVLGNTNSPAGALSEAVEARCELGLRKARQHRRAKVLTTGAFGPRFNTSDTPHGILTARYLVAQGLSPARLLPPVLSARTLEDALLTRVAAVNLGIQRILVITSASHLPRATFLFSRALPEFDLSFEAAAEPPQNLSNRIKEKRALSRERSEWLEPPLIGSGSSTAFPEYAYENAQSEQRFYDNISYLAVAGQFALFAGPYAFLDKLTPTARGWSLMASAVLIAILWILYFRTAIWAGACRRLLYLIEVQWRQPGFSSNYLHRRYGRAGLSSVATRLLPGFGLSILILTALMIAVQIAGAHLSVSQALFKLSDPPAVTCRVN